MAIWLFIFQVSQTVEPENRQPAALKTTVSSFRLPTTGPDLMLPARMASARGLDISRSMVRSSFLAPYFRLNPSFTGKSTTSGDRERVIWR